MSRLRELARTIPHGRMREAAKYILKKGPGKYKSHDIIGEIGHTQFIGGIIKLKAWCNKNPQFGIKITGSGKYESNLNSGGPPLEPDAWIQFIIPPDYYIN